jgi:phosphoglycerate dehydrogenase-like enzyme
MARLHAWLGSGFDLSAGKTLPDPAEFRVLVAGRPTAEHLEASPHLQTLIVPYAGIPQRTRELLGDYGHLAVHNLHHNAAATAEGAVGLLLAAAKRIVPADRALREGDWRPRYRSEEGLLLDGREALVVGLGAIGLRVARVLRAFGLHVLGVSRSGEDRECVDEVFSADRLDEVLPRAQLLVLCCPLTPETQGLLNARRLELLPSDAVLVNVGRGGLIEEAPLYEALSAGRLGAAGLDVWWTYPKSESVRTETQPSSLPFHELQNVVFSPHRAGHGAGVETARVKALAELLRLEARGEPLPNRVDLGVGY